LAVLGVEIVDGAIAGPPARGVQVEPGRSGGAQGAPVASGGPDLRPQTLGGGTLRRGC
jgi:hypothetical protein